MDPAGVTADASGGKHDGTVARHGRRWAQVALHVLHRVAGILSTAGSGARLNNADAAQVG